MRRELPPSQYQDSPLPPLPPPSVTITEISPGDSTPSLEIITPMPMLTKIKFRTSQPLKSTINSNKYNREKQLQFKLNKGLKLTESASSEVIKLPKVGSKSMKSAGSREQPNTS